MNNVLILYRWLWYEIAISIVHLQKHELLDFMIFQYICGRLFWLWKLLIISGNVKLGKK